MNSRNRMISTLRFEEPDRPPHFESMFEVENEAFGMRFPDRNTWAGMSSTEKDRAIGLCCDIYEKIIDRYEWDALAVYWPWSDPDGVRAAAGRFGSEVLIGGMCGDGVWSIENIDDWTAFSIDLFDRPETVHRGAAAKRDKALHKIDVLMDAGADFIFLPNDVAFNAGPFISPDQFSEFVEPYWRAQVDRVHDLGGYAFIHTDGQIMPILDQLIGVGADLLHSIDPMAGVDIAEVKRRTAGKMAIMGNVQCSLLQDGPEDAIRESARYCLNNAAPGGGYVFSTSNTIFPGMPLKNYEIMLDEFRKYTALHGR